MNKKGQALVEFVLILPIFLIIVMTLIDVGNIFLKKYELNKDVDMIATYYQNGEKEKALAYAANEDLSISENHENNMDIITVKKEVEINAPMLSNVLGKKHIITQTKYYIGENNE